jgi:hypothetical protein
MMAKKRPDNIGPAARRARVRVRVAGPGPRGVSTRESTNRCGVKGLKLNALT